MNRQIHEVSEDYTPTVEAGLGFYLEGENRERIKKVVSESLQKPMEFDEQLQIKTQKGKLKWVRVIGASEYREKKSLRLYGLIQDIDEIKRYNWKLSLERSNLGKPLTTLPWEWP